MDTGMSYLTNMNFEGISNMQRDHFIQLDLQSRLTLLCIKTIAETAWGCEESLHKKKQQLRQKVKNTAQELSYQFSNLRGAMGEFSAPLSVQSRTPVPPLPCGH